MFEMSYSRKVHSCPLLHKTTFKVLIEVSTNESNFSNNFDDEACVKSVNKVRQSEIYVL